MTEEDGSLSVLICVTSFMNGPLEAYKHPFLVVNIKQCALSFSFRIVELSSPETRETALLELSKKREVVPDLAPMLWNSFGTIAALLQVLVNCLNWAERV